MDIETRRAVADRVCEAVAVDAAARIAHPRSADDRFEVLVLCTGGRRSARQVAATTFDALCARYRPTEQNLDRCVLDDDDVAPAAVHASVTVMSATPWSQTSLPPRRRFPRDARLYIVVADALPLAPALQSELNRVLGMALTTVSLTTTARVPQPQPLLHVLDAMSAEP